MKYLEVDKMTLNEKIEFLRENPIFWSRFGIEYDAHDFNNSVINAGRHKALADKGIVVHSSVIPIGWVGPDQYDFTLTDKLFDLLFTTCPDIVFLPRIKLNVPKGWCEENPEDVFVYAEGPRSLEDIKAMIGTEVHGSHPCKKTDLLAQQSFSSKKWHADASEALRRFVEHVEASKWASHIIGYHIAYGTSGESSQWGSWDANPRHKGDYGISATKAYVEYAKSRGYDYTEVPRIDKRFYISDNPIPRNRFHVGLPSIDELFYHTAEDEECIIYSEFQREMNVDAIETYCKVVKSIVPEKLTGIFFGYICEPEVCANPQHSGFDRILSSPYVDFLAGPKGYHRVSPTDPGLGQGVPNSVNLKKLWVDEIDNRTHLCKTNNSKDFPAKNFAQTRGVYWREFTENVAFHQGYWWMDLMGGWLDSEEIQDEVKLLNETSQKLYLERDTHEGVSEVLLVIDDNAVHHMRPNYSLHEATINHTGSIIKESGVPTDFYRTADLEELDLSKYKMIVFMNAYYADHDKLKNIFKKLPKDTQILWNYTAGIIDAKDGSFGFDNVSKLTGFKLGEYAKGACADYEVSYFPLVYVENGDGVEAVECYSDGKIRLAKRKDEDGRVHILNAMPYDLTVERSRELLCDAGVHLYTPAYCTVNADNRFIYILAEKDMKLDITLKEPTTCQNVFTGEVYKNAKTVTYDMEEGTCVFLKYIKD